MIFLFFKCALRTEKLYCTTAKQQNCTVHRTHTTVEPQHSHDVTTEVESFTHLLKYV